LKRKVATRKMGKYQRTRVWSNQSKALSGSGGKSTGEVPRRAEGGRGVTLHMTKPNEKYLSKKGEP